MSPAAQRARIGAVCAAFGLLHLAPTLYALLSSGGPVPVVISARAWSLFYFGHFIALTAGVYGWLYRESARSKIFHGGPMLDFTIGLGALVIASSFGRGWIPGVFLIAFGLRMMTGAPLLGR